MGPQLVRCGMCPGWDVEDHCRLASMGPQLVRCGMPAEEAAASTDDNRFNGGPQLVRCGMYVPRQTVYKVGACFNGGRNLFVAE